LEAFAKISNKFSELIKTFAGEIGLQKSCQIDLTVYNVAIK
jgi:hypothetical protein